MKSRKPIYAVFAATLWLVLYSCASIGNPTGGPQDRTPPIFVRSSPAPNECNVKSKKIDLYFDEIVTLKDPSTKIIVSPAQFEVPKFTANGKKVSIEIIDTLLPNTTYTLDFSNSIQDNNEGNPLENFAFAFSTGDSIDSLRVSGIVLDSYTLEPMQGVVVGLHSNLADSAFQKIKMERVSRTNDRGQFTIRNVHPGKYRIFALNDLDRDYKFGNPTEDIAFCDSLIVPFSSFAEAADTIYNIKREIDTILMVPKPRYYPNDILLSMFNENRKAQYLSHNNRIDSTRIQLQFAAPSDTLPELQLIGFDRQPTDWYTLERSQHNDTLTYWIKRPELVSSDTLQVALKSLRTDTLNNLVWGTDTLRFSFQRTKPKKKSKKDEENDSLPQMKFTDLRTLGSTTQEVYAPLLFETGVPIAQLDSTAIHLEIKQDTLWTDVPNFRLSFRDSTINRRTLALRHKWEPGATYRLRVDSIGITDIYGLFNKPFEAQINVRKLEEYGNLFFSIPEVKDSAYVELLNSSDKLVVRVPVKNHRAELINLLPSKYYARLFIDRNGNGKYDTGNYDQLLQPEETYYYPASINLKKNWDVEQTWDIYAQPIDKQKPEEIKKNKPERKKWEEQDTQKRTDEEDEDGFYNFDNPNDPNMRYYNQQNGDNTNFYNNF